MEDLTKLATITVIFYGFGYNNYQGKFEFDTFEQKYYLVNWKDEEDARRLIDEIAHELHYLSGHGIFSIEAKSEEFSFLLSYKDELIPFDENRSHFRYLLKGYIGDSKDLNSLYFTFPRVDAFIPLGTIYTGWNERRIRFFQIKKGEIIRCLIIETR